MAAQIDAELIYNDARQSSDASKPVAFLIFFSNAVENLVLFDLCHSIALLPVLLVFSMKLLASVFA